MPKLKKDSLPLSYYIASKTKDVDFTNNPSDCAIVAYAFLVEMPYSYAYKLFTDNGWYMGKKGTRWMEACKGTGLVINHSFKNKTLLATVRALPKKGRFIIVTRTHALALLDGMLVHTIEDTKFCERVRVVNEIPEL